MKTTNPAAKTNPMIGDEVELVIRGTVVVSYMGSDGSPQFILRDRNSQEWIFAPHLDHVTVFPQGAISPGES